MTVVPAVAATARSAASGASGAAGRALAGAGLLPDGHAEDRAGLELPDQVGLAGHRLPEERRRLADIGRLVGARAADAGQVHVIGGLDGEIVGRPLAAGTEPLERREAVEGEDEVAAGPLDRLVVGVCSHHHPAHLQHLGEHLAHRPGGGAEDLGRVGHPLRLREVAEVVAAVGGQLHPAQRQERLLAGRGPELRETLQRVEVGEHHPVEPGLPGAPHRLARVERDARGVVAVDVEVDEHGWPD